MDANIKTAQLHKSFDPVLDKRIEYRACSLEEIVEETTETFDAVIASEVVEHVIDLETFIQCCCQVLKVRVMEFTFFFSVCVCIHNNKYFIILETRKPGLGDSISAGDYFCLSACLNTGIF